MIFCTLTLASSRAPTADAWEANDDSHDMPRHATDQGLRGETERAADLTSRVKG